MADRLQFYHGQIVSDDELNLAFDQVERALHRLAADTKTFGIVHGLDPGSAAPMPDMTIALSGHGLAYDSAGQRIYVPAPESVDCTVDDDGASTLPSTGQERLISVSVAFERREYDERLDQDGQRLWFRRSESYRIHVIAGPEADPGRATRAPIPPNAVRICDVLLRDGQGSIEPDDIRLGHRDRFLAAEASEVFVNAGGFVRIAQTADTAQAALESADHEIDAARIEAANALEAHVTGASEHHPATDIAFEGHRFLGAGSVHSALTDFVDGLASFSVQAPGSFLVGASDVRYQDLSVDGGTLHSVLRQILGLLYDHGNSQDHDGRYLRRIFAGDRTMADGAQWSEVVTEPPKFVHAGYETGNRRWFESSDSKPLDTFVEPVSPGGPWRIGVINRTGESRTVFLSAFA